MVRFGLVKSCGKLFFFSLLPIRVQKKIISFINLPCLIFIKYWNLWICRWIKSCNHRVFWVFFLHIWIVCDLFNLFVTFKQLQNEKRVDYYTQCKIQLKIEISFVDVHAIVSKKIIIIFSLKWCNSSFIMCLLFRMYDLILTSTLSHWALVSVKCYNAWCIG